MSIRIVCDSTCDLPVEMLAKYNMTMIPFSVLLGDRSYVDCKEITPDDIFAYVEKTGTLPKTSAIPCASYVEVFKNVLDGGDDIVFIGLSSKLSAAHNNAILAVQELADMGYDPKRVRCIDSLQLSTGIALILLHAHELVQANKSLDEIEADLNEYRHRVSSSFILNELKYLQLGGRCSSLTSYAANMLKIHLQIVMPDGSLQQGEKFRGSFCPKVLRKYFEKTVADNLDNIEKDRIFITSTSIGELTETAKAFVEELGVFKEIIITRAGSTITSHCGPNTIGFLFVKKA